MVAYQVLCLALGEYVELEPAPEVDGAGREAWA